jgi:two-component system, chemotaxis family, chemotaxis protein CheY
MLREEVGILIVDDVNAMRVQIKELLKSLGFRKVMLAANGEEAKQIIAVEPPHLMLVDWHMAPCDGMELLKYVRAHRLHKEVAFIMVTAETTKERVMEAIKSGVDDYLIKPLTPIQIQSKVYGILLKKQVLS